jgi:2-C-methyl-D-erythritol 4-phosphate cytidylyltransferase
MTDHCFLIVPASGIGARMNAKKPKQYLHLENGLSVLDQALETLLGMTQIKGCVVAIAQNMLAIQGFLFCFVALRIDLFSHFR